MPTVSRSIPLAMPMNWRKRSPLSDKLGTRSLRFSYPGGSNVPLIATPQAIELRYGAEAGIDRLIGFNLSIQQSATPTSFYMFESNTGWQYSFNFGGGNKGVYVLGNVETFPDEVNLTFSFSASPGSNVDLAFFNFEVVTFSLV